MKAEVAQRKPLTPYTGRQMRHALVRRKKSQKKPTDCGLCRPALGGSSARLVAGRQANRAVSARAFSPGKRFAKQPPVKLPAKLLAGLYSTIAQIRSIASAKISSGADSLNDAFLALISRHLACSHIISPVIFVLLSSLICIGKPLIEFVIGHTRAKLVRV